MRLFEMVSKDCVTDHTWMQQRELRSVPDPERHFLRQESHQEEGDERLGGEDSLAVQHDPVAEQPEAILRGEAVPARLHNKTNRPVPEEFRPLRIQTGPHGCRGLDIPGNDIFSLKI